MPCAAIILGSGLADWQKNQTALRINSYGTPVGRRSSGHPIVLRPGLISGFARMGDGVERPHQLACVEIPGAHVHSRSVGVVLLPLRPRDDQVAVDDSRSAHVIWRIRKFLSDPNSQVDNAFLAKSRNELPSLGV